MKIVYHFLLAFLGAFLYGFPSKRLIVVGITGTKGKSTSVELVADMFRQANYRVASLSSAFIKYADLVEKNPTRNTMPGRMFIQRFLARAKKEGCTHAVIEVTSQGVLQYRHAFIDFDAVGITNLHPEHIEAHGSFEAYRAAKVRFFADVAKRKTKKNPYYLINSAMPDREYFERVVPQERTRHFSRELFISIHAKKFGDLSEWLQASFNVENAALATGISEALNIPPHAIHKTLTTFTGVSGRAELVRGEVLVSKKREKRTTLIDYAVTPDSLTAIYEYAKEKLQGSGGIIAVFGATGGGRDAWKRPAMGKIAGNYCKKIYLTTDDPYDDDPLAITNDIEKGIENNCPREIVLDRAMAIKRAIMEASEDDVVVITGIGSQSYTYGPQGKKTPWNERAVVESVFAK